jgi:hypothetical protein
LKPGAKNVTSDSSAGADNQSDTVSNDAKSGGETSARKVAKTLLDGQIPSVNETCEQPPEVADEKHTKREKRVAKTMLEMIRPSEEEIIAASAAAEQEQLSEKKVAKTMMEISLPLQSDTLKQVKKVSKTMLDVNSLDAIGMAKALKEQQKQVPVKVRKTLTGDRALPDLSRALDALNAASAADDRTVVSHQVDDKTVVSHQVDDKTVASVQVDDETIGSVQNDTVAATANTEDTLKRAKKRTRSTERFVAKTMLDHSVLSEQLVKSHEKEKMKAAYIAQERANEPVKEFNEVDSNKTASPCAWTWSESGGKTGRVRACDTCQTKVYDFSGMEMPEAEALIFKHESKKKFTLFKRVDGKFMTTDCPVQAQRKRNLMLLCLVGTLVVICALALMIMMPKQQMALPAVQTNGTEGTPGGANHNPSPTNATSERSDSNRPTITNKDGKIHFEAGNANLQQAPNPGLLPSVTKPATDPVQGPKGPTQSPGAN